MYYFPVDAKGCHIFAKTDASASSTAISYSIQPVEAMVSGMSVEKTITEQGDHSQRGLHKKNS